MSTSPSPAHALYWNIPGQVLFTVIPILASIAFAYIIWQRLRPVLRAQADPRFDRPMARLRQTLKYWLLQKKHPRYRFAGALHIAIFGGFLVLSLRSLSLVIAGFSDGFALDAILGPFATFYNIAKDYAATLVFVSVVVAAVRRAVFKPQRYAPAKNDTRNHTAEALAVLTLIALLMVSESLFEASGGMLNPGQAEVVAPFTIAAFFWSALSSTPLIWLARIHSTSFLVHEVTFFSFLCFLPFGKHFHVITSFFNIYFAKVERGSVKPVRWDVPEEKLDQLPALGVRRLDDFTWKHQLDFYSCADCGRCSDNCPSRAAGRALSPRFLTIKARDYSFAHHPVLGKESNGSLLVGSIYSAEEIWSCTTCGACEEECPMMVEYIDKIVDLRRALVEDGEVPVSLQKPLKALESRGNPYGKLEKKRADWTKTTSGEAAFQVKLLDGRAQAETLFFVDSIGSYDDRIQRITRATAKILEATGTDYGILGAAEKDSGNEVRRFGEEFLFMALRDANRAAIEESGAVRIVTSDPHAFNALSHDYRGIPPVEHVSQYLARELKDGKLQLKPMEDASAVVAYHDPCYLGRHNQVYDEPRAVLDAIGGLKRVEMERCRDRSFCCGGGGLMLFYEAQENERMGVQRVKMAAEAGANVIVTACPFCMVNIEDAIKVAGFEGKMSAIDLTELVLQQMKVLAASAENTEAARQLSPADVN